MLQQVCSLARDLSDIAKSNTRLINFAWVNIPLVYTQLVQIAVHIYFLFTILGTQVQMMGGQQ